MMKPQQLKYFLFNNQIFWRVFEQRVQPHHIVHASMKDGEQKNIAPKCSCFKKSTKGMSGTNKKKPGKTDVIEEIVPNNVREEGGIDCRICLEPLRTGDIVAIPKDLPCNHFDFHSHCIVPWLLRNNSCPVCRTTYVTGAYERKKRQSFLSWMPPPLMGQYPKQNQLETCNYCESHGLNFPDLC